MALISEMKNILKGEVQMISPYHDNVSPCTDCRYCWGNAGCSIQDDMQIIYDGIDTFDNVIIASPVYSSNVTGQLMNLASRFQTFYAARHFRNAPIKQKQKNGVLLLVGGGDGAPEDAERSARNIFRYLNTKCIGNVYSLHTNQIPAKEDRGAMEKAKEMAHRLNDMYCKIL